MSQLVNVVKAMIALRNPNHAMAVADKLAVKYPEILLELAGELGIIQVGLRIDKSLNFPQEFLPTDFYAELRAIALDDSGRWKSPKIDAIRHLRTETKCGLKEAKDFVEYYFPTSQCG